MYLCFAIIRHFLAEILFFASSKTIIDNMSEKEREYLTFFFPHNRRGAILKNENPSVAIKLISAFLTDDSFDSEHIAKALKSFYFKINIRLRISSNLINGKECYLK